MDSVKLVLAMMLAVAVVQLHGSEADTEIKIFDIATDFNSEKLCRLTLIRAEKEFMEVTPDNALKKANVHDAAVVIVADQKKSKADSDAVLDYDMVD